MSAPQAYLRANNTPGKSLPSISDMTETEDMHRLSSTTPTISFHPSSYQFRARRHRLHRTQVIRANVTATLRRSKLVPRPDQCPSLHPTTPSSPSPSAKRATQASSPTSAPPLPSRPKQTLAFSGNFRPNNDAYSPPTNFTIGRTAV
ncbi:hypothetical protein LshimejAT787_1701730 [Lyophyllum shimeji]|uniref:Uncharacterized protein n=1 Tax=Lyophyllum shimeji TaxID=47721 RepID=A0A9P3UVW5_LYOSH|nr:hypothetical protein LshimejAT787_1701730 [Lyophyllum shimeji]